MYYYFHIFMYLQIDLGKSLVWIIIQTNLFLLKSFWPARLPPEPRVALPAR